jgi:hypothetical protein
MKYKSRNLFHATLLACALLASPAAKGAIQEATIVLPAAPTRVEKFAAAELGKYLEAATGVKATIADTASTMAPAGTVFFVGNLGDDKDRLTQAGFPIAKLGDAELIEEGVCLDSDGKQTLLTGRGERGALNAVYTYLEEGVGCHWPEPGRDFVPKLANWNPPQIHRVVNPQVFWRGWASHGAMTHDYSMLMMDWEAKNRMNSAQIFPAPYQEFTGDKGEFLATILDRGIRPNVGGHSRDFYLNGRIYLAQHPEWFASENGKKTEQLDYTNFDSIPTYAANTIAFLKKHPEIEIVSLWPNDGFGFNPMTSKDKNATDVLLTYVNKLAEAIHAEVPNVKCEFLAYIIYTAAPLSTKPVPWMIPTFCDHYGSFGARDHWHTITDDRAPSNALLCTELKKWIAISGQVTTFSYYGDDCINHFLHNPLYDVMVSDCAYYHSIGLGGNFFLFTNPMSWWSNAETAYAYARASWDKDATPEQIQNDYYTSLYGPAAKPMQEYLKAIKEIHLIAPVKDGSKDYVGAIDISGKNYESLIKQYAEGIAQAKQALADARAAIPADDKYLQERLNKLDSETEYISLWYQVEAGLQEQKKAQSTKLKEHLFALIDEGLKLDVVAYDDLKGYSSANAIFHRRHDAIAAIPCTKP